MCDALGNINILGGPRPLTASDTKVVMVSAQMDSLAFIHDLSLGANADASGRTCVCVW